MIDDALIAKITTLSPAYETIRSLSNRMLKDIWEGENMRSWEYWLMTQRDRKYGEGRNNV